MLSKIEKIISVHKLKRSSRAQLIFPKLSAANSQCYKNICISKNITDIYLKVSEGLDEICVYKCLKSCKAT